MPNLWAIVERRVDFNHQSEINNQEHDGTELPEGTDLEKWFSEKMDSLAAKAKSSPEKQHEIDSQAEAIRRIYEKHKKREEDAVDVSNARLAYDKMQKKAREAYDNGTKENVDAFINAAEEALVLGKKAGWTSEQIKDLEKMIKEQRSLQLLAANKDHIDRKHSK